MAPKITPEQIAEMADRLPWSAEPLTPEQENALERLFDRVKALLPHYAVIVWQADDMEQFRPDWTDEQRRRWMGTYGRKVRDANIEHGWDVLKILLDDYPLEGIGND